MKVPVMVSFLRIVASLDVQLYPKNSITGIFLLILGNCPEHFFVNHLHIIALKSNRVKYHWNSTCDIRKFRHNCQPWSELENRGKNTILKLFIRTWEDFLRWGLFRCDIHHLLINSTSMSKKVRKWVNLR